MFIQEIIIDGFKSYAHRTVVDGFDPHFNAITGLNGSGKSNILDAICFVLGITNLSQVRAGSLSELVYKQGQAGVNKATVTIVFDNNDPNKDNNDNDDDDDDLNDGNDSGGNSNRYHYTCPVGYENCSEVTVTRQVLLGGKSKYLINGRTSTAQQVQNLFHSVQLNVNNPHFLIMQGRVTKVLNMKPKEILGMIEEASGTRMYENKRTTALITIEKKQHKLDEINNILREEITPTLERLRNEKQHYLLWSQNNSNIERLERYVIANQYTNAFNALESNSDDVTQLEQQVQQYQQTSEIHRTAIQDKEDEINTRSKQLKGKLQSEYDKAKKEEQKHSREHVRLTSALKNAQDTASQAEKEMKAAHNLVSEAKHAVDQKKTSVASDAQAIQDKQQAAQDAEEHLERLTLQYQNMSAGISTSSAQEGHDCRTLPEQISKAHGDSKTAEAKVKQAKMKITHLTKELKKVQGELKKQGKAAETLSAKCADAKKKITDIQSQIDRLGFSEFEFKALTQERNELEESIKELSERIDTLLAQLQGRLAFRYKDPVRGFDRSKVKGVVAKLVTVKDDKHSTACEVIAGGKLYQVVVDEAITGKALLDRGELERRVTLIPLDKIQTRQVTDAVCNKAGSIAKSMNTTSHPAIELVTFDEEVRSAIEYVFGTTLVVDGGKAANDICDATKTRTVTLDGDEYHPSGTISGGSNEQFGTTLAKLAELRMAEKDVKEKKQQLATIVAKLDSMKPNAIKFDKLSSQLDLAKAELANTEKHVSQTSVGLLIENRDNMTKEIQEAQDECNTMEKESKEKLELYQNLNSKVNELTEQREHRLKDIEQQVKKAKKDVATKSKVAREATSKSQTQALEIDSLETEVTAAEEAVVAAEKTLSDAQKDVADLQIEVGEIQAVYEDARERLEAFEKEIESRSSDIVALKHQISDLTKEIESATLQAKKLTVDITRIRKERVTAEKTVAAMLKKYAWIESEKSAFGVPGGDYDFNANDPNAAARQLKKLQTEQESLAKKINKKVMGMIEKAESEYTELLRKRKVVENDKKKIQNVIIELDEKKKTELERTWIKVNRDFGSIFTTLLPGTSAKLEPPEGMQAWEGLEVKVAFGDVWKESLSELSGGQRSLLALSLILSLLLFKPAPMYILDEVDAALDLSHTQNIGNMLKTHFSQSQFIVVSLKEGMFNNANVIFRTKFVEGVSTVTRTIGTGSSRARGALLHDNDNENNNKKNGGRLRDKFSTTSNRAGGRRNGKENFR